MTDRVQIRRLPSGVDGLDEVLEGGLPEFSFNLIAGEPGAGKTTLAHQFVFRNASPQSKAIYFTIFGEPAVKMLRYQQQFDFFDSSMLGESIRFVHLGEEMMRGGLARVTECIRQEMEKDQARIVVVDSFRSVARVAQGHPDESPGLESFVQALALLLTSYEATTFLVGEYLEQETNTNPVFTVADRIIWLHQTVLRNSVVRRLRAVKMRGQAQVPGFHTVKLSQKGMRIFPRLPAPIGEWSLSHALGDLGNRKKTGISGLDELLGGGVPAGYSLLVAGPSGSGKTTLATQFILEGIAQGEAGVIAVFEKRPEEYLRTSSRGAELARLIRDDKIALLYIRPLDLSVDETLEELKDAVVRIGAKRVVIDSLSGFELALAPSFREDFRESLYRMVGAVTGLGVTVVLTVEITDSFTELRLSPQGISFLTDGIILLRYVELEGRLQKVMTVVKMRASAHSKDLRPYVIDPDGVVVGPRPLETRRAAFTGGPIAAPLPSPREGRKPSPRPRKKKNKKPR